MAFFPLLSVMKTSGFCTVYNYPPNDWEESNSGSKMLWALYSNGKKWVSRRGNLFISIFFLLLTLWIVQDLHSYEYED